MSAPDDKWFEALHTDLNTLNERMRRIEIAIAKMEGSEIGQKLERHQAKIEGLEEFKSKIIGAMIILHSIWGILAALIIWRITTK